MRNDGDNRQSQAESRRKATQEAEAEEEGEAQIILAKSGGGFLSFPSPP